MKTADTKRLGLILAVQAEIEGMKSENAYREANGIELIYDECYFIKKAEEIREIINKKDEEL